LLDARDIGGDYVQIFFNEIVLFLSDIKRRVGKALTALRNHDLHRFCPNGTDP
jgi:hypothetical protein